MPKAKVVKPTVTKKEFIRRLSEKTGFTHANSKIFFDALIEVMIEIMLEDRCVYFAKFGWFEPYQKPPRLMYRLDNDTGIRLDENGEKVTYMMPETTWIRFKMTEKFKHLINPGVYKDLW